MSITESPPVVNVNIRMASQEDLPSLEELYPRVFPDEDLVPLIRDLLALGPPEVLSLLAEDSVRNTVGHIIFTVCVVGPNETSVALLGPLAVTPTRQNQGIGSALVRRGLQDLSKMDLAMVLVLGSPDYYCRFGFRQEPYVVPPYPLPPNWSSAWQSMNLYPNSSSEGRDNKRQQGLVGELVVPYPWQGKHLWS
ncbi:GNAT family acetyltransferase [Nitzschia inconspicua]|uniref:GNAT family acetyltransferase n=1 Tax=Nitzschia inconspicua TaxID=303405 RepID=A0A9K3KT68_9STRA|nr:GNAT family acetyltransferase [Nitzschia inconspicua]